MTFIGILEPAARPERIVYRALPSRLALQDQQHGSEDDRDTFPRYPLCDESLSTHRKASRGGLITANVKSSLTVGSKMYNEHRSTSNLVWSVRMGINGLRLVKAATKYILPCGQSQ